MHPQLQKKKKTSGRPPGKKNQVKGINMFPPLVTQSLIANSTTTGSQVSTNSSIIETHPRTVTNKFVTTCIKHVVTHYEVVMVCPKEEITYKPSLHNSPINSYTNTKNKKELVSNTSLVLLENSILDMSKLANPTHMGWLTTSRVENE